MISLEWLKPESNEWGFHTVVQQSTTFKPTDSALHGPSEVAELLVVVQIFTVWLETQSRKRDLLYIQPYWEQF